jgi:hypothetical protein
MTWEAFHCCCWLWKQRLRLTIQDGMVLRTRNSPWPTLRMKRGISVPQLQGREFCQQSKWAGNRFSFSGSRKECSFGNLILSWWNLYWTFDLQNWKIINLCLSCKVWGDGKIIHVSFRYISVLSVPPKSCALLCSGSLHALSHLTGLPCSEPLCQQSLQGSLH